jgi:hypothetical protein
LKNLVGKRIATEFPDYHGFLEMGTKGRTEHAHDSRGDVRAGAPHPFADSKPFRIQKVDLDGQGPSEVLVEVRATGLCHSDLSQVK